jgi:hypothetical protein
VKLGGILLLIGGLAMALVSVSLHSYVRATLFVLGGAMIVYGTILATAPPAK